MEEDDIDFTPFQNTSSNLASLFGFTKKPLPGNSSLTYTAPKAPKGESSLAKKPTEERAKSQIIFSKAVHAYKLEKRTYVSQGLIGMVISGNHDSHIYEIILYKRSKEHLCQIRISSKFSVILSPNNYVSFHDSNQKNWSLMFQSIADVEQFTQKLAICKFYSHPEPHTEALIQDSTPHSQQKASLNSTVDVVYNSYALIPEEISKLKGEIKEKIKLSNHTFLQFSKSLIGCSENSKRFIIIPHSLSGPWLNELNPKKDLFLEVKLERILPEPEDLTAESKPSKDGPESPIDSSAEEISVKAKGASIKEALSSTKSQKANLISRMARMGQATLPVKAGLSAGQSDSEEENLLASSPKPRVPRSRISASTPSVNSSFPQAFHPVEGSDQLSVYQNDLSWHQSQIGKPGVVYQQLIPASASPMSSPTTDPNFSVYVSESRIQAAELRMGISKISEKLDLIWNKMQSTSGAGIDSKMHQIALMDSGGILTSIQNLITENGGLKEKVEEQKAKLEQQNDRIFHLLELNHKYLEQNSTTHEKQTASELKLRIEMESLQKKEVELEASNRKALDKMRNLSEDLAKTEEDKKELRKRLDELNAEAEALKKDIEGRNDNRKDELENLTGKLSKSSETILKLEEKLREVISENENLKSVIKAQKEEIDMRYLEMKDSETKKKECEKAVESLKKQISNEELKTESKIDNLSKVVAKLEEENKCLLEKVEKQDYQSDIKSVLPQVLSALKDHFLDPKEYSASEILMTISRIFKHVIEGTLEKHEEKLDATISESSSTKHNVVPAPRKSRLNVETPQKEKGKKEGTEEVTESGLPGMFEGKEEKNGTDCQKKKEEIDSRYKSYDQGWRTTRPPPPPLFDDEDDTDDWLN